MANYALSYELLQAVFGSVRRTGSSVDFYVCCPFCVQRGHSPDTKYRLGITISNNKAHCFQCQWATRDFPSVLEDMGIKIKRLMKAQIVEDVKVEERELPEGYEPLYEYIGQKDGIGDQVKKAVAYALERGITPDQIRQHSVGFTLTGRYARRLVFPVVEYGKTAGFVTRDFTGRADKKYLNSRGSKAIWNGDRMTSKSIVVVFEGILKAMAGERALSEFDGFVCVATLGRTATKSQLDRLEAKSKAIVWYPDPDVVGIEGFWESAEKLPLKSYIAWRLPRVQADEDKLTMVLQSILRSEELTKSDTRMRVVRELTKRKQEDLKCY